MLGSTGSQLRSIDVPYVQAATLHFYARLHRSMVVRHSPNGTNANTSVQSRRTEKPTVDGDLVWSHTHTDVDGPNEGSRAPAEAPQPQCAAAAAAMMHGVSKPPASSYQGGCPTIAEKHQEFIPSMQPPMQPSMQPDVILPNPGYKIPANLWELDVPSRAHEPGPLASFLRHCNTMESPYYPTQQRWCHSTSR